MLTKPLIYALAAAGIALLVAGLCAWSRHRKRQKQFQEMSHLHRRNEALNDALRNPLAKQDRAGSDGPMEITWDDKAVKEGGAVSSLMMELVELAAYSRRKYVFRAGPPVTVGSGENNQVVLPREGVEERHCEICLNAGKLCVRSVSNARTILKRKKTMVLVDSEGVYLRSGDHIQLGTAELQFRTFKS